MSSPDAPPVVRHAAWTRCTHWVAALSIAVLAVTGFVILMAHPRLYWGEVGNSLTPALLELPISRNHRHGGWTGTTPIFDRTGSPVSANRTYAIFNQNSWGRSLHFLSAWLLLVTGGLYVLAGVLSGHLRRHVMPRGDDLVPRTLADDARRHLRFAVPPAGGGPTYGPLQKIAYTMVVSLLLPLAVLTGVTMSPTVTASAPWLLSVFGGVQSARTIHFGVWVALVLFVIAHVVMVVATGFRRHMRAMTIGD